MWGGMHGGQTMVMMMRKEGCVMCDDTSQAIITLANSMSETEFLNEKPTKKQDQKTNEKWKVPEKQLSEVFFSFFLFLSAFLCCFFD